MTATDNKNIITTFIERVLNDRALEHADAIVAEDFIELDPSLDRRRDGRG